MVNHHIARDFASRNIGFNHNFICAKTSGRTIINFAIHIVGIYTHHRHIISATLVSSI